MRIGVCRGNTDARQLPIIAAAIPSLPRAHQWPLGDHSCSLVSQIPRGTSIDQNLKVGVAPTTQEPLRTPDAESDLGFLLGR